MATVMEGGAPETLAELLEQLGNVPPERIRAHPAPGTATEQDVLAVLEACDKRLCELVDGVLVEKDMSAEASLLAGILVQILWQFVGPRRLGWVLPPDGAFRLFPGLVRIPDVSFILRERATGGKFPKDRLLKLAPDLAVEVLSPGNTPAEMKRKVREYFLAGIPLVWIIDPQKETAEVFTSPGKRKRIAREGVLEGKNILTGFMLPLKELFDRAKD